MLRHAHSLNPNCWPHFILPQCLSKHISNKLAFVPVTLIMEAHIYYPFLLFFIATAAEPMIIIGHRCCYPSQYLVSLLLETGANILLDWGQYFAQHSANVFLDTGANILLERVQYFA